MPHPRDALRKGALTPCSEYPCRAGAPHRNGPSAGVKATECAITHTHTHPHARRRKRKRTRSPAWSRPSSPRSSPTSFLPPRPRLTRSTGAHLTHLRHSLHSPPFPARSPTITPRPNRTPSSRSTSPATPRPAARLPSLARAPCLPPCARRARSRSPARSTPPRLSSTPA